MASFDDKTIFGKKENRKSSAVSEEEALEELQGDLAEDVELQESEEASASIEHSSEELEMFSEPGSNTKVIGEDYIESEKEKKLRLRRENKEKILQEKAREQMIKNHRKEMKKNPEIIKRYETDPNKGLPNEIVEKRVFDNLVNTSKKGSTKSIKKIIFSNIFTFFNILTFAIAGWLISVQAFLDLVFLVIVTANLCIGIYQEIRAKKAIDRLSLISAPIATVIRSGVVQEINTEDVVLDDLLVLKSGDQICSDSIVVTDSIEVNESLLTGESDSVIKHPGDLLFSGSFVVSGRCKARVDKIGKENYIERLSDQAKKYKKPNSDLLKSLKLIIIVMAFLIIPIGLTLFFLQYFGGVEYVTAVRKSVGAMIGMIPSGLWLLTSVALFVGIIRLSQKNVLVQELYCIEMLARVDVLCLDKTGTITDGTMNVKNVIDYNSMYGLTTKNIVSAMLNALNESNLTSVALEEKFGLNKRIKHLAIIPFSSQRKFNAVTFDKIGTFALGAPEFVLKQHFELVKKEVNKYAALGYRVLSLAHFNGAIENQKLPNSDPELVSLILIEDNIRPDAINTINYFKTSGVAVRVISGDNPITVSKISERAGIENADQYISLDGLSDAEVERAALKYTVFGRVSPTQKRLLVTTLKAAGHIVAMTGDGVNDILALKEADCSIAIASGSEAARNVSHLVLSDSNFDSMPKVVAEGRRVINNVTSVASLFLTKTIFSLLLAIQAMINGGSYPISTNQLIIIDIFAIGLPSVFLVLEPNNREVQGKFMTNIIKGALPGALTILIISMLVFMLSYSLNLDSISLSTIIVIAATHTCLMVLFKVCKPLNTLRRTLCIVSYSAFLIITFLLPQLLEFRPLVSFSEYYSSSVKIEQQMLYPKVEISNDYYYVYNGKVTNYQRVSSETNISISSIYEQETSSFYYAFNGTNVRESVVIPEMSYLENEHVVLGGDRVFIEDKSTQDPIYLQYRPDFYERIVVSSDGYLFFNTAENLSDSAVLRPIMKTLTKTDTYYKFYNKYGATKTQNVQICIMPTIELKNDQFIINTVNSNLSTTENKKTYKTNLTSSDKIKLSLNPETMELLVNNAPIRASLDDGTLDNETYKILLPTFSFASDSSVVYNGIETQVLTSAFGIENIILDNKIADVSNIKILPYDASYYIVEKDATSITTGIGFNSDVRLSNPAICPTVSTTEYGYYIIDGYYTDYKVISNSLEPKMDSEYNLVLGTVVTDYKLPSTTISTTTGGIVKELTVQAKIFLVMLCLLAVPLMRVLQAVVPWCKKQLQLIQKLISKF